MRIEVLTYFGGRFLKRSVRARCSAGPGEPLAYFEVHARHQVLDMNLALRTKT